MNVVETLGYIGVFGAVIGAFICWFVSMANMFRTVANRKPGVPFKAHWWESPFNILFRPEQLTDRGLSARRWCIYGVFGFLACMLLFMVVGMTTGVLH